MRAASPLNIFWCDDASVVIDSELDRVEISFVADIAEQLLVMLVKGSGSQTNRAVDATQAGLVIWLPVRANHPKQTADTCV